MRSHQPVPIRLCLVLFLLAAGGTCLRGAPYGPQGLATEFIQPDGTRLSLRVFGDEFHARTETADGYSVVFDPAAGAYFYASLSADGQELVSTGVAAAAAKPRTPDLPQRVAISATAARAEALARYQQWDQVTGNSQRWNELKAYRRAVETAKTEDGPQPAPPSFTTTGNKAGLTLLIDFSDDPATIPQANIVDFCNGDTYSGYRNNGSVKKYFQDNSNNLLTYTNTVTAYIRMALPKSYYNDTSKGCGPRGNLLIKEALDIMKALPNYNTEILPTFDSLTVDGSNNIIACNVFYAGGNGGVWSFGLWPHSWSLYNVGAQPLSVGGKKVFKYQISNIGNSLELGTFCHENGHMLCGYPDIYDYGGDSAGGAGGFCLMNSGGHGSNPVLICAYLKRAAGWTTETNLTSSSNLVGSLVSGVGATGYNQLYRYAKPGGSSEYFLFENRHKTGRDANIAASGIAIWHIDELGDRDNQSLIPNASHANYEVTLVQADNLWHFQNNSNSGDSKDLYYLGNTAAAYTNLFSDDSSPHAHWWSGASSGLQAGDFSAAATTMTLRFGLPGTLADALDSSDLTWTTSGSANWFPQAATTHDGVDSAQSGVLANNQNSSLQTTTSQAGTLTFWWKVSSESGHDFLRFYLDNVEQTTAAGISGEVGWTQKSIPIPAGSHALRWTYAKDGSTAGGADAGWVDQVTFTPTPQPEIVVEQPAGTDLSAGAAAADSGSADIGTAANPLIFTVKNTGAAALSGLALTADGTHAADFSLGALGATTLAPGTTTTFTVTFTPTATGPRSAALHLASNDADENPFDIALTGYGRSPLESWRFTHFGSAANTGIGNDAADADGDGLPNLLEYALKLDPTAEDPFPITAGETATTLSLIYPRNQAASDVILSYEKSDDLGVNDPWSPVTLTEDIVGIPANGIEIIKATLTLTPEESRKFLKIKVDYRQ